MKNNKILLGFFVMALVLFVVPVAVHADVDNSTIGDDNNVTANVTDTTIPDTNVTNTTTPDANTINTTLSDTNVTANVTDSNVTTNVTTNVTANVTLNVTTNVTANVSDDDETDDDSNETEVDDDDVSAMKYNHGMEVRLLQLQKSIVKQLKSGNLILEEIDNQNFSVDTTKLEGHVDDLTALNLEIANELAKDPVNVSTERFVAFRHEATRITFEFKAELYSLLTPAQLNMIKDGLKDKLKLKYSEELKVEEKFKAKVREYNQEVALKMLEKFGEDNAELKEKILAGERNSKELRDLLKEDYKNLAEAKKNQLKIKIQEEKNKESKEKLKLEAKVKGLNDDEVAKIIKDGSLTQVEKQAKLRVLAKERSEENKGNNSDSKDDDSEDEDDDNADSNERNGWR
jgi:hypothetical protein